MGNPLAIVVTAGQRHESIVFEELMENVKIKGKKGRPKQRPEAIAGDRAYSTKRIRTWCKIWRIKAVIPQKNNENRVYSFDKELYKNRNVVERCIGWLKEFRRVATRYEKNVQSFLEMIKLAISVLFLRKYFSNTP